MNPEMISTVESMLDMLTEKLGPAASQVFEIAIRHSYIVGITDMIVAAILLVVIIAGILWAKKLSNLPDPGFYSNTDHALGTVLIVLCVIVAFVFFITTLYDGIMHLVIPQWYAISDVLQYIK